MSRKGNSLDDGLMEGFFGILKREMFYSFEKTFKTMDELEQAIKNTFITTIMIESKRY